MSWWSELFSPISNTVNKAIDLIPTEEGKLKARAEFIKAVGETKAKLEDEITKRSISDMNSDSFLAKNIRPIVCALFTIYIFALPFLHDVSTAIIDLYTNIAISIYGFYFGSVGLEKITSILSNKKKE